MISTAPTAMPRTWGQRVLDALVTRLERLPPPTTDYTVRRDLRIPTRDGIELLADLYEPTTAARARCSCGRPTGTRP